MGFQDVGTSWKLRLAETGLAEARLVEARLAETGLPETGLPETTAWGYAGSLHNTPREGSRKPKQTNKRNNKQQIQKVLINN